MRNTHFGLTRAALALACAAGLTYAGSVHASSEPGGGGEAADKGKKPSISLRTSPQTGFSPLRVVATAELRGGDNHYEDFYCPVIEWEWGDGTRSEQRVDCDPYEAGKSEVRRRYTIERQFPTAGEYRVVFRMKQNNRIVGSAQTLLRVRPGVRDGGGWPDDR